MKPKVFLAKTVPQKVEDYIARYCLYRKWSMDTPISRKELLTAAADVEGLLLVGHQVDQELLDHAPCLKIVSTISVGYDNFDLDAMKRGKIMGTNTPNVLNETVADMVFGLILGVARRIPELNSYVKEGKWEKGDYSKFYGLDVHHATLGIIGLGAIGEAIARRARFGFDMKVLYHNRRRKEDLEESLGVHYRSLEELLQESDFVVLMTPQTMATMNLMGHAQFALMQPSAFFINAARGGIVDEAALTLALKEKKIRGAGLDVFQKEPVDPKNPLLQMPNVITLPHIASSTDKTRAAMAMRAAENMIAGVTGRIPPNLVPELR